MNSCEIIKCVCVFASVVLSIVIIVKLDKNCSNENFKAYCGKGSARLPDGTCIKDDGTPDKEDFCVNISGGTKGCACDGGYTVGGI